MKIRVPIQIFFIVCILVFEGFAKEDHLAEKAIPRLEVDSLTESEFSGNPIVDEADAGNVSDSAVTNVSEIVSAESAPEETAFNENSEADSTDSEAEMSQEEADAELAADMITADSATIDTLQKLVLDMTTAFVPSASRRISAPLRHPHLSHAPWRRPWTLPWRRPHYCSRIYRCRCESSQPGPSQRLWQVRHH